MVAKNTAENCRCYFILPHRPVEMDRCECVPLNSKFARKSVLVVVKTKPFNRETVISINHPFKVLSTDRNTIPSALAVTDQWPCRWRSAWTQPRHKLTAAVQFVDDLKQRLISVW